MARLKFFPTLLFSLILLASTQIASARNWEVASDAEIGQYTAFCFTDPDTGLRFCFGLRCRAGQSLEWFLLNSWTYDGANGGGLHVSIDPSFRRTMLVDPDSDLLLDLRPDPKRPDRLYSRHFDPARHHYVLNMLRNGRNVVLEGHDFFTDQWNLSLQGSSRGIDQILRICPVTAQPSLAHQPQPRPSPSKAARAAERLASEQAAPARPGLPNFNAPLPPPPGLPGAGAESGATDRLDALTLRARILERRITWGDGTAAVTFHNGGRSVAEQDGASLTGNWQMVPDGRICWSDGSANGCFRFLRRANDGLALRLETGAGNRDLGVIRFE